MANILDPVSAVAAKVSADGSLQVYDGGDGWPSFSAQIYHPRITTAIAAAGVLWAIRAPATKFLVIRGGVLRLALDTVTTVEVGVELVRFTSADPTGGTGPFVAGRKKTSDPIAVTTVIRGATAVAGVSMTGTTVESTLNALLHMSIPFQAGSQAERDLGDLNGFELAPGEGFVIRANPTAAPIGLTTSGFLEFSERT